jgi:hypothetical protein
MLLPAPTLPCSRSLSTACDARIRQSRMQASAIAVAAATTCPYCGQPVTKQQLEEIRSRVRAEEQARLQALERQLREQAAAQMRAERAKLAKREQALAERAKALEAGAKARFDDGYRKAQGEAVRMQRQLQKQVDELKRRLERRTADDLGALSEEELFERLRREYPGDLIERVPRGVNGADIVHEVRDGGAVCGRIVYESKNVKNFLSAYVDKARGYRTRYSTPYVILVTTAFPAGEREFCAREGVLLVHPAKVVYLTDLLRASLIELARAGAARAERDSKGERLLTYVTSDEFKQRLRGLLDAVDDLRNLQTEERKRHEATWGAQEEAFRGMEQFAGRIQARVRAIVEGR